MFQAAPARKLEKEDLENNRITYLSAIVDVEDAPETGRDEVESGGELFSEFGEGEEGDVTDAADELEDEETIFHVEKAPILHPLRLLSCRDSCFSFVKAWRDDLETSSFPCCFTFAAPPVGRDSIQAVQDVKDLKELAAKLRTVEEFEVDLEHNTYRTEDYIVDTFKLRLHVGPYLRELFKDPKKGKLKSLGFSYEWDCELSTTEPNYYNWTQWIFLQLYKRGLAYQAEVPVNWCPALGTVLANEEVVDGVSERGGHPIIRKQPMRQWMLKITAYADRLLEDLDELKWPESRKEMQRNWIGRS
ncbi:unnamed protein product [Thlaspi arvense]|uniref:leucine--tRNA ligase n=1 Tax=Thlaspi arvense TaxID=13288 RepID=A0AAU9RVB1_THLAR|nr:unnamed protein product [Thlaspi arvense]